MRRHIYNVKVSNRQLLVTPVPYLLIYILPEANEPTKAAVHSKAFVTLML